MTYQCTHFSAKPKSNDCNIVYWLVRYLVGTKNKGYYINPNLHLGLQVYIGVDFAGNWDNSSPETDRDTARSRYRFIISYLGTPITWKSQLQTEIALSSTESEYTRLSYALYGALPIMYMLREMQQLGLQVNSSILVIKCRVFEDNS